MNRRDWLIAAPVLASLAGCLAAFMHGVQLESSFDGIAAMRALPTPHGSRVAVVAAQALHVLDSDGKRLARQELRTLGLAGSPNDLDLTVDDEGRLEAWLFEDADPQPRVIRCAWSEEQRRMERCTVAATGSQLKWSAQSRAVHLAVDRRGQRMFVADAQSARVQVFNLAGKRIGGSEPAALPLSFPNRLRYLGGDELAIADNDHHQLVWAAFRSGTSPRLVSTLAASAHPQARSNSTKVTDAAFGHSGAIWMLAVKQGQKYGDVLVFDRARRPVRRAELPDGADPLVVEATGDLAIVADYSLVMLYRLDAAGRYLGEFGDDAFRAELVPMRATAARSKWWTRGSMALGAVVILAGILLAWRFGQKPVPAVRREAQTGFEALPILPLRFPVVLDPGEPYLAAMRKLAWTLGAALAVAFAGLAVVIGVGWWRGASMGQLTVQLAFMAIMSVLAGRYIVRELRHPVQLRITVSRVGLFREGKCIAQAPLGEVYASDRMLLVGNTRVAYRGGNPKSSKVPSKYDPELLADALFRRLPEAQLIDDFTLNRKVFAQQPIWVRVLLPIALIPIVVWIFRDLFPI